MELNERRKKIFQRKRKRKRREKRKEKQNQIKGKQMRKAVCDQNR